MMLQFWKKDKQKSPNSSPNKLPNGNAQISPEQFNLSGFSSLSIICSDATGYKRCEPKSRLSLELQDVLQNRSALSNFCQFMEARSNLNILLMWLDLEQIPLPLRAQSRSSLMSQSTESMSDITDSEINLMSKIVKLYLSEDSHSKVRIPDDLRAELSYDTASKARYCLDILKDYVFHTMCKESWGDFLISDWHARYIVDVMTSGTMTLSDVLFSDTCLSNFIEFLEQEGLITIIEFWLAASSFEKQFNSLEDPSNLEQIQRDAIIIYEKYIGLEGKQRVGVSDSVRRQTEESICCLDSARLLCCFSSALLSVERLMSDPLLSQYLGSHHYLSLLSDVVMGSSSTPSPPASVSSHESLLPDPLSHRKQSRSGLSFGRIDKLGRYIADFEPEPDKKVSSLGKMFKKLVNKEDDKDHEEMAWRVAEMIVKEITNITLANGKQDCEEIIEDD